MNQRTIKTAQQFLQTIEEAAKRADEAKRNTFAAADLAMTAGQQAEICYWEVNHTDTPESVKEAADRVADTANEALAWAAEAAEAAKTATCYFLLTIKVALEVGTEEAYKVADKSLSLLLYHNFNKIYRQAPSLIV